MDDVLSDKPDITSDLRTSKAVKVHFPEAVTLRDSDEDEEEHEVDDDITMEDESEEDQ